MKHTDRHSEPISNAILQFIKKKGLVKPGQHVIVAVSGGIDSMVLLDFLAKNKDLLKISLSVAHINHQLRGRDSKADEKLVVRTAQKFEIPFYIKDVPTKQFAVREKVSIQEAARTLRYEFFDSLKRSLNADLIATAHNADDNAETMLFHFIRGTGIHGLSGIPVRRNEFVRPLLATTRKEIEKYAESNTVAFRNDVSNLKEEYTRNYIRHSIIPKIIGRINPSLLHTMQRESETFRLLSDFIDTEVRRLYESTVLDSSIKLKEFNTVDPYMRQMIVRRLLEVHGIEPSFSVIASLLNLAELQKGSSVDISKEWIAERSADTIFLHRRAVQTGFEFAVHEVSTVSNDLFTFSIQRALNVKNKKSNNPSIEYVDAAAVSFPLTIRSWKPGDTMVPLGMKGKKKLSDLFGELKFTSEQKSSIPVVVSGDTILWVAGVRLNDQFKITGKTKNIYKLSITYHGKKNGRR